MRIGILGGTFDPPHVGHLLAATDAFEALGLDRIVFIPAAEQPLKAGSGVAPAHDRLAMVGLAIEGDPRYSVDAVEIERGGLSYSVDTLRTLHERWREDRALALFLLLGEDVVATLPKWREPHVLASLAELAILTRAPRPNDAGTVGEERRAAGRVVQTRRVDVSSTEIRARVRAGKSIRGFVPAAVDEYIAEHRLYR
jgi:nicotinate-nucleotide adenylyltransferase